MICLGDTTSTQTAVLRASRLAEFTSTADIVRSEQNIVERVVSQSLTMVRRRDQMGFAGCCSICEPVRRAKKQRYRYDQIERELYKSPVEEHAHTGCQHSQKEDLRDVLSLGPDTEVGHRRPTRTTGFCR